MGSVEQNLIKQSKRAGVPIPDRIKNKPRLASGLELYLEAFFDLEYERQWLDGGIALPMAWTTMHNYATAYNFTGNAYDDLIYFLKELDDEYLKHITKKARANANAP